MSKPIASAAFGLLLVIASACAFGQGALEPPAGPPAPLMKTLDQVEPRKPIKNADLPLTITQPGSYYLTEPIKFVTQNTDAIVIASDNVTIDLNGLSMTGPWTSGAGTGSAIATAANKHIENIRISNGTVTNWAGTGINLNLTYWPHEYKTGGTCWYFYLTQVTSNKNGGSGITGSAHGYVDRCIASDNIGNGIDIQFWGAITYCNVNNNGLNGIVSDMSSNIANNTTAFNGGAAPASSAGIQVRAGFGGRCQIRNNLCDEDSIGILLTGQGNVLIGNCVIWTSQKKNYSFSGDGFWGPVVTQGTMPGTNPPNPNFSYQ